jgi:hypothetical protein
MVTELPDRLDLGAWPAGSRLIVRRESPHRGAQFTISTSTATAHRVLTDQTGDVSVLDMRHRQRARVEDCIQAGK